METLIAGAPAARGVLTSVGREERSKYSADGHPEAREKLTTSLYSARFDRTQLGKMAN